MAQDDEFQVQTGLATPGGKWAVAAAEIRSGPGRLPKSYIVCNETGPSTIACRRTEPQSVFRVLPALMLT